MKIIATQPIERKALSTLEHPRHHANSRGQDDVPESVRGRQRFRLELQRSKWLPASVVATILEWRISQPAARF